MVSSVAHTAIDCLLLMSIFFYRFSQVLLRTNYEENIGRKSCRWLRCMCKISVFSFKSELCTYIWLISECPVLPYISPSSPKNIIAMTPCYTTSQQLRQRNPSMGIGKGLKKKKKKKRQKPSSRIDITARAANVVEFLTLQSA